MSDEREQAAPGIELQIESQIEPQREPQAENNAESGASSPEIGGPKGPEPTRYGDWERGGRCIDF